MLPLQMAAVVLEHHPDLLAVPFQQRHRRIVAASCQFPMFIAVNQPAQGRRDQIAVSADRNGLSGVLLYDFPQCGNAPLANLPEGFRSLQPPLIRMEGEIVHLLGILPPGCSKGQLLPWADMHLTEPHIRMQRKSLGQAQRRGGILAR